MQLGGCRVLSRGIWAAEGPTRLLRANRYISVQSSDEPVMGISAFRDSFKLGAGCCAAVTKERHFGL